MVNTPNLGREATQTGSETRANIRKPNKLNALSTTVLAGAIAALTPLHAGAQGYAGSRIDDENAVKILAVHGTGYEANMATDDSGRMVTVTGGPAGSEVILDAACPAGNDYELKITDTRLHHREDKPTNDERQTKNVTHVHVDMAITGSNYMTIACDNKDGDPKEMQLVFETDPSAKATGDVSPIHHSSSPFDSLGSKWHLGAGAALSLEQITPGVGQKTKYDTGFGGVVHGAVQVSDSVDVGLRLNALWQPVEGHDVNSDGTPNGRTYTTHLPLITAGAELGIDLGDFARVSVGPCVVHSFGQGFDTYRAVNSDTSAAAMGDISLFFGTPGELQGELNAHVQVNPKEDTPTIFYIGVGVAK